MGLFRKERGRLRSQIVTLFRYKKGLVQRKKTTLFLMFLNKKQLLYAAAKLQGNIRERCRVKAKELCICIAKLWNFNYCRILSPGLR